MVYRTSCMRLRVAVVLAVGLVTPSVGSGQAAKGKAAPHGAVEIEEITVTAQKREESIQETPISVTAITAAALEQKGVQSLVDIGKAVPNLSLHVQAGDRSQLVAGMRGVIQAQPDPSYPPKVGIYADGVYIAYLHGSNMDLEDLERVEVLRGPQGTLYGRNTIAGTVNFITNKPTEERSITLNTEVGNYNAFRARATVNVPLIGKNGFFQSDALGTLSLRETAGWKGHDGFYHNGYEPGMPAVYPLKGAADFNNENRMSNFTALRWQPAKDITVDYTFGYNRMYQRGDAWRITYVYPNSLAAVPAFGPGIPNPFYTVPYVVKNRTDSYPGTDVLLTDGSRIGELNYSQGRRHTLTASWDLGDIGALGAVTLKSISGYRDMEVQGANDTTGVVPILNTNNNQQSQHWSEELQLTGAAPRVHYVLGAYYFGDHTSYLQDIVAFQAAKIPYRNLIKDQSYAAYGQATWTPPILSDKLSLTAGLRFTKDQAHMQHFQNRHVDPHSTDPGFEATLGKAFGGFNGAGMPGVAPMGNVSYQWTNDLMTYFRVSRGYATGGLNGSTGIKELFLPFKPEHLWAFEAGFKSQWLDNRLRINADGFFSLFKDLQENVFHASPTAGTQSIIANVEKAELWGTEFEATAILFRGLEATASYSFLAPKYTEWTDQKFDANGLPIFDAHGNPVLESVANKRAFPDSPQHQINLGLTYTAPPTSAGIFSAHIETYWQDKENFQANNDSPGWQAVEGWAYALVNGSVSFSEIPLEKGTLDIAVFGRNILDRKYRSTGTDLGQGLGVAFQMYGDPRTFGLRLTYNFKES